MNGMSQSKPVQECMTACLDCRRECFAMAMTHCLREGGKHVEQEHLALMFNCASLCQTTADFLSAESSLHSELCRVCATVCGACAQSCAQLDGMEPCEHTCRECEKACRALFEPAAPLSGSDTDLPTTGMRGGPPRQGM